MSATASLVHDRRSVDRARPDHGPAPSREHLHSDLVTARLVWRGCGPLWPTSADPVAGFSFITRGRPDAGRQRTPAIDSIRSTRRAPSSRPLITKGPKRPPNAITAQATIDKLAAEIPLQQQRVQMRQTLFEKGLELKILYLQEEQDLVANQKEVLVQQSHKNEAAAALQALVDQRVQTVSEYQRGLADDLVKADAKAAGLEQDLIKATRKTGLQRLAAPVAGTVQQFAVHTVGGVVTPAQALLVVVPSDSHLEIEAMVSNRDIGFVHPGQRADIKVETFNYTRYGLLHGEVESVSADAVTPDKRDEDPNARPTGLDKDAASTDTGARSRSMPREFRSTRRQWWLTAGPSAWPPAWRSRPKSRPARATSSATSCRRCCAMATKPCASDEKHSIAWAQADNEAMPAAPAAAQPRLEGGEPHRAGPAVGQAGMVDHRPMPAAPALRLDHMPGPQILQPEGVARRHPVHC